MASLTKKLLEAARMADLQLALDDPGYREKLMDLISLGVVVLGGYIGILVLYSVLTYIQYTVKYHKAKKSVKQYYTQLTKLEKIYTREEKKFAGREMSGGYRK